MPAIPFPLSRPLYIAPPTLMVRAGNESSRLSRRHVRALQRAHPGWWERNQEIRPLRTFAFSKEPRYLQPHCFQLLFFSFGGCCMYRKSRAVALFLLSLLTVGSLTFGQAFAAGEDSRFDALKRFSQVLDIVERYYVKETPRPVSGEPARSKGLLESRRSPLNHAVEGRIQGYAGKHVGDSSASASKSRWRTTSSPS